MIKWKYKIYTYLFALPLYIIAEENCLSVCAIFRNEGRILKEWLEFHRMQGVRHFYLYNNLSTDDFMAILKPYVESDIVTLTNWDRDYTAAKKPEEFPEWLNVQISAYNDCLINYGKDNKWIAFIDMDEFLFCPKMERIDIFLKDYENYAGLVVNWLNFGTSFIHELPEGELMTKNFIYCSDGTFWRDFSIKSIVKPSRVERCLTAHTFLPKRGYLIVDVNKLEHSSQIRTRNINIDKIRINHYWTRDEKFFINKKIPSRQDRRSFQTAEIFDKFAENLNRKIDREILKFVPQLEKNLNDTSY